MDFGTENLTNGVRGVTLLDRPGFGEDARTTWTGGMLPDRFTSIDLKPWFYTILVMVAVHDLREPAAARLEDGARLDRRARGRDGSVGDGRPADADEALGVRDRRRLRRLRRRVLRPFIGSVFPTSFFFNISVIILCMVIVGGMGNIYGVVLGAVVLLSTSTSRGSTRSASAHQRRHRRGRNRLRRRHPEVQVPHLRARCSS